MRRAALLLVAVAAAGACRSEGQGAGSRAGTSTTTAVATTVAAEPSTTTMAAAGPSSCRASQLQLSADGGTEQARSQASWFFVFRNVSEEECFLNGHPGVQLVAEDGTPQSQEVTHGGGYTIGDDPPNRRVPMPSNGRAWFAVSSHAGCGPDQTPAPRTSALLVIPPDDTEQMRIAVKIPYCPGGSSPTVTSVQPSKQALSG